MLVCVTCIIVLAGGGVAVLILIIICVVVSNKNQAAAKEAAAAAAAAAGSTSQVAQGQVIAQGQVGVEMPRFDVNTGLPLAPAGGQGAMVAQLQELKQLLDTGVLSQAEFETQKKMILAGPSVHA